MSTSKVIILTGASRGLGWAIAHYLLQRQHRLVVVARSEQPLRELEKKYAGQVAVLTGDFADTSLGAKAVELAQGQWQRIDGLIVNHGVLEPVQRIIDSTADDWRSAFNVNFFSALSMAQAAIPYLRRSNGRIILTSSGAAKTAYPTWGAYGSSKAALNHLAMTLGNEEKDITTVAIRPGTIDTEMQREIREKHNTVMDEKEVKKFAELKSSGSLLAPELPGNVMARLILGVPPELSGSFLEWNAEELARFQDGPLGGDGVADEERR